MKPIKLLLVAGARPNFMKIAPMFRAMAKRSGRFEPILVHTGQHYDAGMSDVFFAEFGLPQPDYHLAVGSASHAEQTARIMMKFEPVLLEAAPDWVVVVGDVNSTLACTVVAKKLGFPVAHVEAGLRSLDRSMPEEINRLVTDSISDLMLASEPAGAVNLKAEGHPESCIHYVGNVMIDNLYFEVGKLDASPTAAVPSPEGDYGVVTLHRPSNVDERESLTGIVESLNWTAERLPLVFPAHPRTRARLGEFGLSLGAQIELCDPLGYRDFLRLWKDAKLVLTDSGGLQEETTGLGVPCITVRENTERPITVEAGTNVLVGQDGAALRSVVEDVLAGRGKAGRRPDLWDGKAAERILDVFEAGAA